MSKSNPNCQALPSAAKRQPVCGMQHALQNPTDTDDCREACWQRDVNHAVCLAPAASFQCCTRLQGALALSPAVKPLQLAAHHRPGCPPHAIWVATSCRCRRAAGHMVPLPGCGWFASAGNLGLQVAERAVVPVSRCEMSSAAARCRIPHPGPKHGELQHSSRCSWPGTHACVELQRFSKCSWPGTRA